MRRPLISSVLIYAARAADAVRGQRRRPKSFDDLRDLGVLPKSDRLNPELLYRAMVSLDSDDPGVFNVVAISEPDTRPVAAALAAEHDRLAAEKETP